MTALQALRLTTYVVVAAGVASLHVGEVVGAPGLGFFALVLGLGWWLGERYRPPSALLRVLVAALLVAAAVDVLYLSAMAFDAFVRLLVVLVLLRLITARTPRELRAAGLLAFFMLVASTTVTFGVGFLFVLVAFVVAGIAMLLLGHDLTEVERAGGGEADVRALPASRGLLALGLAASAASLLVTLALFFVIPRVGEATLALRGAGRRILVGFTDRVELGAIGELENDETVAMRVELRGEPAPAEVLARLRWRGLALERFDGRVWSTERHRRVALARRPGGAVEIATPRGRAWPLVQTIFLEPVGTDVVFAAPHATRLWIRGGATLVDDNGALAMPAAGSRLSYTVESAVGAEPWGGAVADAGRYLQLPPMAPRIAALARDVAARARNEREAAAALVAFFSRGFRYTLTLERTTPLEPLEEFLFVRRAGNCEYFASALAVMLRALGIPARVVNGFQHGEWNPYGGYFLVRMGDAHSWVEANLDGAGWVTLDPSPRNTSEGTAASGSVSLWLDALRVRWYRYIVSWSQQDQIMVAASLRRAAWDSPRVSVDWRRGRAPALAFGTAVALAVVGWLVWRRTGAAGVHAVAAAPPPFYRRALRALARRGVRPAAGETAREFAARVAGAAPATAAAFARVTAAYEAVRFGGARADAGAHAALDEFLATLSRVRL